MDEIDIWRSAEQMLKLYGAEDGFQTASLPPVADCAEASILASDDPSSRLVVLNGPGKRAFYMGEW